MRLEKWYLDCVTSDGAGMIGYAARAGFGPLGLRVAEAMQWRSGEPAVPGRTVLGGPMPVAFSEGVDWSNPGLDISGRWQLGMPAMSAMILHDEPAGRIEWTCFCPAARAGVSLAGRQYAGAGYAERLTVTLPVSRMPLQELHWGRFIADGQSCIWLRWLGPVGRSWHFHNGLAVAAAVSGPRQFTWDKHQLHLAEGTTIRSGRVGDSVLGGARWLRQLLPAAVLDLEETKWCSPGILTDPDGTQHHGWAVHEIVRFP